MKRMTIFALTCLLAATMLTGCRGNSSGAETMPSTVPATAAPTQPATQPPTQATTKPTDSIQPTQGSDPTRPSGKEMPNPMDRTENGGAY